MMLYIFRSGIRKISLNANSLDEAKTKLVEFEPTAWIYTDWNWKIEVLNDYH